MGTVAALLAIAVLLPTITRFAQAAIPMLVGLLAVLALLRAGAPGRGRR